MTMTLDELLARWPSEIPFKGCLIDADGCMCAQGQVLHYIGGMTPDDLRKIKQADADRKTAKLLGISRAHAVLLRRVNDSMPGAPTCVLTEPEKVLGDQAQRVLAFWRHLDCMSAADWQKVDAAWAAAWDAAGDAARAAAWAAARDAAWDAARAAAWDAARDAAWDAAWDAAGDAAWAAAWDAAGDAARAAAWAAAWDAAGDAARAAARDAARDAARAAAWDAARDAARDAAWDAAGAAAWASNEIQGAAVMRERGQPFFFLPMFGFATPEEIV